ncbi:hypothetical protein J6590_002428 [Homalodisca vitripennis]|nr:hypothetical protein J6590_002428 [Homalodisca vitripennis]
MLCLVVLSIVVTAVLGCNSALHRYPPPVTSVSQGHLRGTWVNTRGGRSVAAFLGVPYATPPICSLRFKTAVELKPWMGVYDAGSDGPACIQRSLSAKIPLMPTTYGSEDCLYLNLFSPNITPEAKLPVAVFIHGGYFEVGASKSFLYGPQYLLDEDIVLVTVNYRLGILGFLSLDDPALPGNLGLKDQRAALRWLRDNLSQFGGDPQAVTLFGESAGAASVHYHMKFTAHEGLFRAGICNSGSALAPWALHQSSSQRALVELVVKHTNCPQTPNQLLDCLRQLPSSQFQELLHIAKRNDISLQERVTMVGPVVEVEGVTDPLVTQHPWNLTTHLPFLLGSNEMEGLFWLVDIEKDKSDKKFEKLSLNYSTILPFNLHFDNTQDPSQMAAKLRQFYFNKGNIDRKHFSKLVDLFSDALFNYDLVQSARHSKGKTYFYQMNYRGSNSVVNLLGSKSRYGVSHFDEMFYLFPIGGLLLRNETASDILLSKQLVKMWTNFIKYLDPTPKGLPVKWESVSSPDIEYLNIGQDGFRMEKGFLKDRVNFWESLLSNELKLN